LKEIKPQSSHDGYRILAMILGGANPQTFVFVGVLGPVCAVGATITGLIFMLAEDGRS
jgi:hypothetical protein